MNKSVIISLSVVGALVLFIIFGYNYLVSKEEDTNEAWSNVETQYKRRADLIPNLVATVKGYAKHESETLEAVVAARASATQIKVDSENLTPQKLKEYQAAQGQITSALGKLLMIQERYPDLKANENFKDLQVQLEGTENRIATAITRFNGKAKKLNALVRKFPFNLFGFEKRAYFEATEAEKETPKVEF